MENKGFERIEYDYYSNASSYVKMILDSLPSVSLEMKQAVKELYNYYLNRFDEETINEIIKVSAMYREEMNRHTIDDLSKHTEYIYNNFISKFVFDSYNRETIFNVMHETMKVYVSYFPKKERIESNSIVNYVR